MNRLLLTLLFLAGVCLQVKSQDAYSVSVSSPPIMIQSGYKKHGVKSLYRMYKYWFCVGGGRNYTGSGRMDLYIGGRLHVFQNEIWYEVEKPTPMGLPLVTVLDMVFAQFELYPKYKFIQKKRFQASVLGGLMLSGRLFYMDATYVTGAIWREDYSIDEFRKVTGGLTFGLGADIWTRKKTNYFLEVRGNHLLIDLSKDPRVSGRIITPHIVLGVRFPSLNFHRGPIYQPRIENSSPK